MSWYGEIRQWIAEKEIRLLLLTQVSPGIYRIYGKYANAPLEEALKDKNLLVRLHAVVALGETGAVSAIPALIEVLKDKNEDRYVHGEAAEALVKIGKPAVPALIAALNGGNTTVRETAASALGKIRAASAVPALIDALKGEESFLQAIAAWALEKIAEETDIDLRAVERALKDHVDSVKSKGNPAGTKKAEGEAAGYYMAIAEALRRRTAAKHSLAGDGIILVGETLKPPSDKKMYRLGGRKVPA